MTTHSRTPVKVGQDDIDASVNALAGLDAFAARSASFTAEPGTDQPDADVVARFRDLMDDDLDTPNAMAHIFDTIRRANSAIDAGDANVGALVAAVHEMCGALGLVLASAGAVDADAAAKAKALDAARAAKDFTAADALRNELQAAGWIVETGKGGTTLRRG